MLDRLKKVLSIPSTSDNTVLMTHFILKSVPKSCKALVDEAGNILIVKGNSSLYPCFTAHLDTVHSWGNVSIIEKDGVLTSPIGIGGDDKCGIFICLELLQILDMVKVVFFQKEEVGCRGSNKIKLEWFNDCRYIVGLDRKGNSDFILGEYSTKTASKEFKKACLPTLKEHKYVVNYQGLTTDSLNLASRKVGLSCCNMSVGYYNPHTVAESVVISDVFNALSLAIKLEKTLGIKKYPFMPIIVPANNDWPNHNRAGGAKCIECKGFYNYERLDWNNLKTGWVCEKCSAKLPSAGKTILIQPKKYACSGCGKLFSSGFHFTYVGGKRYCETCKSGNSPPAHGVKSDACLNCPNLGDNEELCKDCNKIAKPFAKDEILNCILYDSCSDCPSFARCDLPRVVKETAQEFVAFDCEKCKAMLYYEPEWCCDCPKQSKKLTNYW